MSVVSHHELPRSGTLKLGGIPDLSRRFVCVVSNPTTTTFAECQQAVGVSVGSDHPEFTGASCTQIEFNEALDGNRFHVEVICQYGSAFSDAEPDPEVDPTFDPNPLLRPDIWTFETQGVAVPALYYYDANSNVTQKPLTNSAYDYFENLLVDEAQTRVTVTGNRIQFPATQAAALTNVINSSPWLGAPAHHWKCQGVSATLKYEEITVPADGGGVAKAVVRFWEISTTLMYRQGGWNLLLPDVGFNYLAGGQKRRAMTFDFENAEWIPSPVPMGLDGSGNQTFGTPAILTRRIYRAIDFNQYFSVPPPLSTT
jgi:hypothetical protein